MLWDVLGQIDPVVEADELPESHVEVFGRRVPGASKMHDLHITPQASAVNQERYQPSAPGAAVGTSPIT